ncbi:MAG: ubiquinol-cytochrome c reductase iron-sulfur subunit [Pirellulales bacterium]|nr:ubiquinol-cytochrome c reductase iron-sulfur subunit [Pirellulales bacterium]
MADKKKMSVADILAAARRADGGAASEPPASPPPAEESSAPVEEATAAVPAEEAASEPAPKPAAPQPAAGGARPSVKDILAAARSGGSAGAAKPAAPAPKKEVPAAAAKAAPAKKEPAEKKVAPAKAAGAKDTASILAAARNPNKAGPVSKAEAAEKGVVAKEKPAKAPLVAPPMPAKPAAVGKPPGKGAAAADADRRGILGLILGSFLGAGFTSLAATSGLWGLGAARFAFPNVLTEPPSRFKVGFPNDFPPGQVADKFKAQFGVWVVNTEWQGQQQIFALRTVCTHLGCTPNWLEGEQKFKCPCHGSGFYKDGINFEGPAPRPLERYAIRLADDGQLEIDKSRIFQEEMGQWKDPNCFVMV